VRRLWLALREEPRYHGEELKSTPPPVWVWTRSAPLISRHAGRLIRLTILILWALLVIGSRDISLTMDEPFHIARGYAFLAMGREAFWYFSRANNPPLLNVAQASLVYGGNPDIPLDRLDGWGSDFKAYTDALIPYLLPLERTEILARAPSWFLAILLASVIARWSSDIMGPTAGAISAVIFALDPLVLSNGRLATTDLGVTAVGTVTLYCLWRWQRQRTWYWTLLMGLAAGLTLLTKHSSVLYAATLGVVGLLAIVGPLIESGWKQVHTRRADRHPTLRTSSQLALAALIALCATWAGYLFSFGKPAVGSVTIPAPEFWDAVLGMSSTPTTRITVLLGEVRYGSRWWYFPLNYLIKNPLPLLIATAVGAEVVVRRRKLLSGIGPLALFGVVYSSVAVFKGINVSYRHMLPVHPLLHILGGLGTGVVIETIRVMPTTLRLRRIASTGVIASLAIWYLVGTLGIFPNELTYFNELVDGPSGAPRIMVDYTQDWGQSFKQLRTYLAEHPGEEPQIFVFTPVKPQHYGVDYSVLDSVAQYHPLPGRYVLGPGPIYGLVGTGQREYDWFRHRTPTDVVANALYVYEVHEPIQWLAQCSAPVTPLGSAAVTEGFGVPGLRQVSFDCRQSWVYPGGGSATDSTGSYALHGQLIRWTHSRIPGLAGSHASAQDSFIEEHLLGLQLAYVHRQYDTLPAFVLYENWQGSGPAEPALRLAYPARIASGPRDLTLEGKPVSPMVVGEHLRFEGARVLQGGGVPTVETWWRVLRGGIGAPFSIIGHLVSEDGVMVDGNDGFGVSVSDLATGDIVVQRHAFEGAAMLDGLWLRTGAYWLEASEEPWPIEGIPDANALFVPLASLTPE